MKTKKRVYTKRTKRTKKDIYEIITDEVISGIERDGLEWFKCWEHTLAVSHSTGKPYNGINQMLLASQIAHKGYTNGEFITFNKAVEMGGKITKGSKSHIVVFWNISFYTTDSNGKRTYYKKREHIPTGMDYQKSMSPRYYRVFNMDCIEGLEPKHKQADVVKGTIYEPKDEVKDIYNNMPQKPTLANGGDRAYYSPSEHHIQMPKEKKFADTDSYYKVLFHEMIHSTGNKDLLNRSTLVDANKFGGQSYSREELVAEIGAMFLSGIVGLNPINDKQNSLAYVKGWVQYLKEHTKEILVASGQSTKAVQFILNSK